MSDTYVFSLGQRNPARRAYASSPVSNVTTAPGSISSAGGMFGSNAESGLEPFDAYAYASARVGMRFGGPVSPIVLAVVPDP
jgi:hypothetical protein